MSSNDWTNLNDDLKSSDLYAKICQEEKARGPLGELPENTSVMILDDIAEALIEYIGNADVHGFLITTPFFTDKDIARALVRSKKRVNIILSKDYEKYGVDALNILRGVKGIGLSEVEMIGDRAVGRLTPKDKDTAIRCFGISRPNAKRGRSQLHSKTIVGYKGGRLEDGRYFVAPTTSIQGSWNMTQGGRNNIEQMVFSNVPEITVPLAVRFHALHQNSEGLSDFSANIKPGFTLLPVNIPSKKNEDVKAALLKLDPLDDSHWVQTGAAKGLPKLNAVEEACGRANLTRQDIEAAAVPGFNRDVCMRDICELQRVEIDRLDRQISSPSIPEEAVAA